MIFWIEEGLGGGGGGGAAPTSAVIMESWKHDIDLFSFD